MSTDLFDEGEVAALVSIHHFRYGLRTGDDFVAEPKVVAKRAEFYSRTLQRATYKHQASDVAFSRCAGMMVYAMDCYAFDFSYCARKSCLNVAKILRAIRGDNGLDVTPRYVLLQDRALEADPTSQLVRIAEIASTAESLLKKATPEWVSGVAKEGANNRVELQEWVNYAHNTAEGIRRRGILAVECFESVHSQLIKAVYALHSRAKHRVTRKAKPQPVREGSRCLAVSTQV